MAKSQKDKQKQKVKDLQDQLNALQTSHKRLLLEQQRHIDFHVDQIRKSLKRVMERHESKPGQPVDPETMDSLRDAHATIGFLKNSLADCRSAQVADDIPSHNGDNGNDIGSH